MYALTDNKLEFYGKHLSGLNVARDVLCKIVVGDTSVCVYDNTNNVLRTFVKSDVKEIGIEQELDNNANPLLRAAVGALVFGAAGAVAGALSTIGCNETKKISFIQTDNDLIIFQA